MAYIKNNWVDREGTTRYFETVDSDGAKIFTPDYTQVTELGTPVNADNMNHIEEGIAAGSFTKFDLNTTYAKDDLVTTIIDDELKVYKSLQDNNTGYLTDSTWEEVEFSGGGGTGLQMFDTILKDHLLTYEESKGLALQGTYVYKEAIAGSRYGYPDFYNKCLEEYQNATNEQVYLKSNITKIGSVVDTNGILSNLSTGNYAKSDIAVNLGTANSWEILTKHNITSVGSVDDGFMGILGGAYNVNYYLNGANKITIQLSSNGTSYNIGTIPMLQAVPLSTDFYIKAEFTGSAYNLYYGTTIENLELQGSITSSTRVSSRSNNFALGVDEAEKHNKWVGTIDLKDCYININGSRWWSGVDLLEYKKNSNGHIFYDIAQKEIVDEVFTSTGMAWFYGIDTENERVFLPRNHWFEQLTGYAPEVNKAFEAGLPNITSETYLYTIAGGDSYGAITMTDTGASYRVGDGGTTGRTKRLDLDASNSSPVYGKSNTVQPNAVKKLLYICVGNTESQSTITDVVDVTTTENDTLPLGYHFYQAGAQPSVSYLISAGQWNPGKAYETFYNEFVQKVGQAFAGGKVVNHTDDYTDYDLVLNQDGMTFRLPLLDGSEDIVDYNNGEGVTLSTTPQKITRNGYLIIRQGAQNGKVVNIYNASGERIFYFEQYTSYEAGKSASVFLPKGDYTISGGAESINFYPCKGNGNLYFKVDNAVQNLALLNAGKVLEAVADIATTVESTPHIVKRYVNGNSGYRLWSDGWCEQWGISHATEAERQFTFLLPFKTIPIINITVYGYFGQGLLTGSAEYQYITPRAVSLTGFKSYISNYGTCWEARGYIA